MTETQLLNLMLSAQDLGISPLKAINGGFYVVNGKVCMSTSMMVDKIRRSGHSIKIIIMTNQKCTIQATRKDNGDTMNLEYTMEDANAAGLSGSATWKKYPKIMLYNRCMSTIARILFPDVVGSAYSEEERFDIQGVPASQRPLEVPEEQKDIVIQAERLDESTGEIKGLDPMSEEQAARLDVLIMEVDDKDYLKKITSHLGLDSIYQIKSQDYDRVIKSLEKKKKEKNIQEMVESGHPMKQALAAALDTARKAGAKIKRKKANG